MDRHSIAQFRTATDFVTSQFAADLSARCAARANDSPSTAASMGREAPLIDNLKTRRQALGWSVKDVADRCGIDEKSLSEWEAGSASPRLDAVQPWAAALGLHVSLVPAENQLRHGLRVDWDRRCITVDGTPVRLTPMEWKALERLAWEPGELVTHRMLFHHLYGEDRIYRAESTAIRVLITKLRRLLPLRIEAQWGKGYVVSGLDPSLGRAPGGGVVADGSAESEAATTPCTAPRDPSIRRDLDLDGSGVRRVAEVPRPQSRCRAEELGVIERFLAERGATRCPDIASIQQSPLPTLVWDKVKRKWMRPR